jgi:predicted DNA-binding transcriptional regulator AlpA
MNIPITNNAHELSTFVRGALMRLTPTSTITIEHAPGIPTLAIERAVVAPELLRLFEGTLRRDTIHKPHETYLPAPAVARMLGIKTATLTKWRRQGRGPSGAVRTSATSVSYPTSEVEAFMNSWAKGGVLNADPIGRIHGSSAGTEVGQTK